MHMELTSDAMQCRASASPSRSRLQNWGSAASSRSTSSERQRRGGDRRYSAAHGYQPHTLEEFRAQGYDAKRERYWMLGTLGADVDTEGLQVRSLGRCCCSLQYNLATAHDAMEMRCSSKHLHLRRSCQQVCIALSLRTDSPVCLMQKKREKAERIRSLSQSIRQRNQALAESSPGTQAQSTKSPAADESPSLGRARMQEYARTVQRAASHNRPPLPKKFRWIPLSVQR